MQYFFLLENPIPNAAAKSMIRAEYGEKLKSYSYTANTAKINSGAGHVMRLIKGKKLSYSICYDMEDGKLCLLYS